MMTDDSSTFDDLSTIEKYSQLKDVIPHAPYSTLAFGPQGAPGFTRFCTSEDSSEGSQLELGVPVAPPLLASSADAADGLGMVELDRLQDILLCESHGSACTHGVHKHDPTDVKSQFMSIMGPMASDDVAVATEVVAILGNRSRSGEFLLCWCLSGSHAHADAELNSPHCTLSQLCQ